MIEHLDYEETNNFFMECKRVLRPGGIARIVVPDFDKLIDSYNQNHDVDSFIHASYLVGKKPKTIETVINTELKEVVKWLRLNKLSLNAAKTELIFFRSNKHPLNYDNIFIKLNGLRLKPVEYIKVAMHLLSTLPYVQK